MGNKKNMQEHFEYVSCLKWSWMIEWNVIFKNENNEKLGNQLKQNITNNFDI